MELGTVKEKIKADVSSVSLSSEGRRFNLVSLQSNVFDRFESVTCIDDNKKEWERILEACESNPPLIGGSCRVYSQTSIHVPVGEKLFWMFLFFNFRLKRTNMYTCGKNRIFCWKAKEKKHLRLLWVEFKCWSFLFVFVERAWSTGEWMERG